MYAHTKCVFIFLEHAIKENTITSNNCIPHYIKEGKCKLGLLQ